MTGARRAPLGADKHAVSSSQGRRDGAQEVAFVAASRRSSAEERGVPAERGEVERWIGRYCRTLAVALKEATQAARTFCALDAGGFVAGWQVDADGQSSCSWEDWSWGLPSGLNGPVQRTDGAATRIGFQFTVGPRREIGGGRELHGNACLLRLGRARVLLGLLSDGTCASRVGVDAGLHAVGAVAELALDTLRASERGEYWQACWRAFGARTGLRLVVDRSARAVLWTQSELPGQDGGWHASLPPLEELCAASANELIVAAEHLLEHPGSVVELSLCPGATVVAAAALDVAPSVFSSDDRVALLLEVLPSRQREIVRLSARERTVAGLLVKGYTCLNIAAKLEVSETTIRTYVRRIYRKLGVADRLALSQMVSSWAGGESWQ